MDNVLGKLAKLPTGKKMILVVLASYLTIALFAPAIMPYAANDFRNERLDTPSSTHLLGTDELGHDIFSMLINGFRMTLFMALIAGFVSTTLGTMLAFISAYFAGLVDDILHLIANLFLMVVVIMFVAVFAAPTLANTILAIVFFSWTRVYKIVRAKLLDCMKRNRVVYTLSLKGSFLDVARVLAPDVLPLWGSFFVLQCNRAVMYETTEVRMFFWTSSRCKTKTISIV